MVSNAAELNVYIVRHGSTEWSSTGQHTGRTDIPLSRQGEAEARRLRSQLVDVSFAHVLTSPLTRAKQTCAFAGLAEAAVVEPDLAEWDYGDYEGLRSLDIRKTCPNWNLFRDGCPGGETTEQVSSRADRLLARLRTMYGTVAIFSHGQFGAVLVARWIGEPVLQAQHFQLGTASVSILGFDPHHPEVPVISLLNSRGRPMQDAADYKRTDDTAASQAQGIGWKIEGREVPEAAPSAGNSNRVPIFPLRFEPIYQYRLWGGRRLAHLLSKPLPPDVPIGEAWVLSDRDDFPSQVVDGPMKGWTIKQLIDRWPSQLLGDLAGSFQRFPLLLKFLDAHEKLSVQCIRLIRKGNTSRRASTEKRKPGSCSKPNRQLAFTPGSRAALTRLT